MNGIPIIGSNAIALSMASPPFSLVKKILIACVLVASPLVGIEQFVIEEDDCDVIENAIALEPMIDNRLIFSSFILMLEALNKN